MATPRIYINDITSFVGKNITKFLSEAIPGQSANAVEEDEENDLEIVKNNSELCYKICTSDDKIAPNLLISEYFKKQKRRDFLENVLDCEYIVYDISESSHQIDEAVEVAQYIHANMDKIDSSRVFILVSSLMTWARTKSLDPEDTELAFTEEEFRRRQAHINFKRHLIAEKTILKLAKSAKQLSTYVIASGIAYGCGEHMFHVFFKRAWSNLPIPIYGDGQNVLPTIHVTDLANIILNVIDKPPKQKYIIAVDESLNTLETTVKAIAKKFGKCKPEMVSKEDALLDEEMEQMNYDLLLMDLKIDAYSIRELMNINWKATSGLVEHIELVVDEYRQTRSLMPLRIAILGPPGVGKTTLARKLASYYKINHLVVNQVVEQEIEAMKTIIAKSNEEKEEEEEEETEEPDVYKLMEDITECLQENNRLSDEILVNLYKRRFKSSGNTNQGFIIDGFPKNTEQAQLLFGDQENQEESADVQKNNFIPEFVLQLEASDEFLQTRVMDLPESVVMNTHLNEEDFKRRLENYQMVNTIEQSVSTFFEDWDIIPINLDVTRSELASPVALFNSAQNLIGKSRNYGPTKQEIERLRIEEAIEREKTEQQEISQLKEQQIEEANTRSSKIAEWNKKLDDLRIEENELIQTRSIPLRNYLMSHVMPILTEGLINCCKMRPEDPIDYLAEYLLAKNDQMD